MLANGVTSITSTSITRMLKGNQCLLAEGREMSITMVCQYGIILLMIVDYAEESIQTSEITKLILEDCAVAFCNKQCNYQHHHHLSV